MSQTCLVTGALGFIGSHLCEALLDDGWTVRGLDCLTDFTPVAQNRRRLATLASRGEHGLLGVHANWRRRVAPIGATGGSRSVRPRRTLGSIGCRVPP